MRGHGRRSILARENENADNASRSCQRRQPASAPALSSNGSLSQDSVSAILGQYTHTSTTRPHDEHNPKMRALDTQHPAAHLLHAIPSGAGGRDALDEWIYRRRSAQYGKKAAASGYQQQLAAALSNQWRSAPAADGSGARSEPLRPSLRLVTLAQPRVQAHRFLGAAPSGVWAYGALGGPLN